MRAATAAAEPPEEPPGTRARSQGFRVFLKALFSVDEPIANSSMFVLPITIAPARFEPRHRGGREGRPVALEDARAAGRREALDVEDVLDRDGDAGQGRSRPARGECCVEPRGPGRERGPSSTSRKASIFGSTAAMRSRWARATSTAETSAGHDSPPDLRGRQAVERRSSPDDPGDAEETVRGVGRGSRGSASRARPSRGSSSRKVPVVSGVAHRLDLVQVQGLDRLRVGEDLVELAGEERALRRRVRERRARRATWSTVSTVAFGMTG